MAGPTIVAKFISDTKGFTDGVDKATTEGGSKVGSFAKNAAVAIGGAFVADQVFQFATDCISAASDVNESIAKIGVVFGDNADEIEAWSASAAESLKMSQGEALSAVGTFGNLAVALGLPQDQAADMSTSLVELGADMASFNNVPVDQALNALKSGLTGETEPLKAFGVNLNESTIKAKAMSMGLVGMSVDANKLSMSQETLDKATRKTAEALKEHGASSQEYTDAVRDQEQAQAKLDGVMAGSAEPLDAAAKSQASYALIMEQTTTAQGDVERSSGTLASQQKEAGAKFEDMKVKIGNALIPVMATLVDTIITVIDNVHVVGDAVKSFTGFLDENKIAIAAVAAVLLVWNANTIVQTAALALLWIQVTALTVAQKATAAAQWLLNAAMSANPIGVVVAIIAALVAGLIWAYQNVDWFRNAVDAMGRAVVAAFNWVKDAAMAAFNWLKDNWPLVLAIITGPIGIAVLLISKNWDTIKSAFSAAIDFIGNVAGTVIDLIKRPFEQAVDAVTWLWETLKSGAQGAVDFVTGIFSGLGDAITGPIKSAWNALAGLWNSNVGGFGFSVPDWVPGAGGKSFSIPDLPQLAAGGVLTQPTLFIGGEAGREIVTPETLMRQIIREETGGGAAYELNIYPRTADAGDIAYGFRRLELMAGFQ
jgi:hypothetical protein